MENYNKEQYLKELYKETAEEFDFKNLEEYIPDKTSVIEKIKSWWSSHTKVSPEEMEKREAQYKAELYTRDHLYPFYPYTEPIPPTGFTRSWRLFKRRIWEQYKKFDNWLDCEGGYDGGAAFEGSLKMDWLRHRQ